MLKKFMVEMIRPGFGENLSSEFGRLAEQINEAVARLRGKIFWQESYILDDKVISIFYAEDISAVHELENESELAMDLVALVKDHIDPTSAIQADLPYEPLDQSGSNFVI